jgi:hypothetical protein
MDDLLELKRPPRSMTDEQRQAVELYGSVEEARAQADAAFNAFRRHNTHPSSALTTLRLRMLQRNPTFPKPCVDRQIDWHDLVAS